MRAGGGDALGRAGDHDLAGRVEVGDPHVAVGPPAGDLDLVVVEAEDRGHRARAVAAGVVHRLGPLGDEAHALVEAERAGGGERGVLAEAVAGAERSARCRGARRRRAPSGSRRTWQSWALRVSFSSSASASSSRRARSRSAISDASSTSSQLSCSAHGRPMPGRCEPWPGKVKASISGGTPVGRSSEAEVRCGECDLSTALEVSQTQGLPAGYL